MARVMTKEEEDEMEVMMRQRRAGRSSAFYGGDPLSPRSSLGLGNPSGDGITRSSGYVEIIENKSSSNSFSINLSETKKNDVVFSNSARFSMGWAATPGRRPNMEDATVIFGQFRGKKDEDYIGLFDGHGGSAAAHFASQHLHDILSKHLTKLDPLHSLTQAFLDVQSKLKEDNIAGGTTALVIYVKGDTVYVANAGDCRAVLFQGKKVKRITQDHKPDLPDEIARIESVGGTVMRTTTAKGKVISRVNGVLAVSRALGNLGLAPAVSPEPEISQFSLGSSKTEDKPEFLVVACDGLWDVLTDEEATNIAQAETNPEQAAVKLRETGLSRMSNDNISVVVIRF